MRPIDDSLSSKPPPRRCALSAGRDQWVIGSPTSLGGRHASATILAQSAPERERAGVPVAGRPPASPRGVRTGSACATGRPFAGVRPAAWRCPSQGRRRPSKARLGPAERRGARPCPAAPRPRCPCAAPGSAGAAPSSGQGAVGSPKERDRSRQGSMPRRRNVVLLLAGGTSTAPLGPGLPSRRRAVTPTSASRRVPDRARLRGSPPPPCQRPARPVLAKPGRRLFGTED